jgi:hypothetical protein
LSTYSLSVLENGKKYLATTVMPKQVKFDTLKFSKSLGPLANGDTYTVTPIFIDPSTQGNNYRFLLKINSEIDNTYYIQNDNVGNGAANARPLFNPNISINTNDTVELEMRCIDLQTYTYFKTLSDISGGGPGGGTTPSNPPNNITENKALGYFSAHTVAKRKMILRQ